MPYQRPLHQTWVLALLVAGCFSSTSGAEEPGGETLPALDCVINPHKVFDLGSSVRGVLQQVHVERSDFVEQGEVVAELDAEVERAAVAVARARSEITSEMLLGQLNYEFDERRKDRIANLYANNSVSIQNKEDAELAAELSEQRLQEATERDKIRKLELWRAQEQLEQKVIRSPSSGFVLKRFKSAGEYVEDQPVVRIAQPDTLNVEVIAPMDLFGKIHVGMTATVYPETQDNAPRTAEVAIVDPMGDVASGTFGVRLSLPNADYAVPAGVKCQLSFDATSADENAIGAAHLAARKANQAKRREGSNGEWASVEPDAGEANHTATHPEEPAFRQ